MCVRLFIVHIGGGCVRLQTLYRTKLAISALLWQYVRCFSLGASSQEGWGSGAAGVGC